MEVGERKYVVSLQRESPPRKLRPQRPESVLESLQIGGVVVPHLIPSLPKLEAGLIHPLIKWL